MKLEPFRTVTSDHVLRSLPTPLTRELASQAVSALAVVERQAINALVASSL